jgi:hypothetical protein
MRRFFYALLTCSVAGVWPTIASADNKEFSQAVATALRDSGRLSNYSIGVTSKDGVVYLKGRVANQEQMAEAVQMSSSMPGVMKVVNQLQIKPGAAKAPPNPTAKADQFAARVAADAQNAAEEAMTTVRTTVFPDPSLPPQSQPKNKDLVSKLRAKRPTVTKATASSADEKMYAVRQVSQNVPGSFSPGDGSQAMQAPGPQMRMAMAAPLAAAGMAAGVMGQCPPGAMGGGPGMSPGAGMGPGGSGMGGPGSGPLPMGVPAVGGGIAPPRYDQPYMPNYAWPSYAAYPNYAAVTYPRQYSPTAWPYIGPFYPYPQVPLGWRKVTLEWDDGWWMLNFKQ